MPFMIEQPYRPICPAFVSFGPGGFSEKQAQTVISVHGSDMEPVASCGEGHHARYSRTHIRWGRENAWIFRTFQDFALRVRKHAYPFDYAGFQEPLELMRFGNNTESYSDWAMHLGAGNQSARKLTLVAELSAPSDYEGGELEVWGPTGVRTVTERGLGSFTAFPSYALHRTQPVTKGTRWCIAGYLYGPPFV